MSAVWHVKKADGKRLGPVSLPELQGWARKGRIGPNDWLSVDGFNWREADAFAPLEMTCRVRQPGGRSLGPVHVRYLAELLLAGEVRPVDPAEDTRTGEKSTALKTVLRGLLDAETRARNPRVGEGGATVPAEPVPEIPEQPMPPETSPEADLETQPLQATCDQLREEQQQLVIRLQQAEESLQAVTGEKERLRSDLERLEQVAHQWLERSKQGQEKMAKIERERDLAVQALEGVQARHDAVLRKWEKEKASWSQSGGQAEKSQQEAAMRIRRAEDEARAWREKYEQVRQQPPVAPPAASESPSAGLGKLDEAHIRLKVAISEKQRLEEECARLRRRLAALEQ